MGKGGACMVARAVFNIQCSVFRKTSRRQACLKTPQKNHKNSGIFHLNTEHWILNTAQAKSLGTHGVIYVVEEVDPIALIQQKLKVMEESGELAQRNAELQKKARSSVERPKPVEGITKATKSRVFYFDPSYVVKENLYDHQGRVFAKKGAKFNPLETVSLSHNLLFFDGDNPDQVAWAKEQLLHTKREHPSETLHSLLRNRRYMLPEQWGCQTIPPQGLG